MKVGVHMGFGLTVLLWKHLQGSGDAIKGREDRKGLLDTTVLAAEDQHNQFLKGHLVYPAVYLVLELFIN